MKNIYLLFFTIFIIIPRNCVSQSILLNPSTEGGFDMGTNFAANNWTAANTGFNNWVVGTGSINSGLHGAYIGTTTIFTGEPTPAINHFFNSTPINIPEGATNIYLRFRYKQPIVDPGNDSFIVSVGIDTSPLPSAGITPQNVYSRIYVNTSDIFPSYTELGPFDLSGYAGSNIRVVFTHINNGTGTAGIPAVDSVSLTHCMVHISGQDQICKDGFYTLSTPTSGGIWSSDNEFIAAVDIFSGEMFGVDPGTALITYAIPSTECIDTKTVTVNPRPSVIAGFTVFCEGTSGMLTNSVPGGTWGTPDTSIATINEYTAMVSAIGPGTATISYTLPTGCYRSTIVTVNELPSAITGTTELCAGTSTELSCSPEGGTWESNNFFVASVHPLTGTLTGNSEGTSTITYTSPTFCPRVATVNILNAPANIWGTTDVCYGSSGVLYSYPANGFWSATDPAMVVIDTALGTFTALNTGTVVVSYSLNSGCSKTSTINIFSNNPIEGQNHACIGTPSTYSIDDFWGTWSVNNNSIATIDPSNGTLYGIAPGSVMVSYTSLSGCLSLKGVSVEYNPSATITNAYPEICQTSSDIFEVSSNVPVTWSSSSASIASINPVSGEVTGNDTGICTIYCVAGNVCGEHTDSSVVRILPIPDAGSITGPGGVCTGATINLTSSVSGGAWQSNNELLSSVNSDGTVTGLVAGSTTISYIVTNSCGSDIAVHPITVLEFPSAGTVTGPTSMCVGTTITLNPSISGGTWQRINGHVSILGNTVFGTSSGVDTILYNVTYTCGTAIATFIISVNALPDVGVLSSVSSVCVGSSIHISPSISTGTWNIGSSLATINSAGILTGIDSGVVIVSYTVTELCSNTAYTTVTINALPNAGNISGVSEMCVGGSTTLSATVSGGTWSASNSNISLSGSSIYGVASGTTVITYTVSDICTSRVTSSITINPIPNAGTILGPNLVCVGHTVNLSTTLPGGTWSKINSSVYLSSSGAITGSFAGINTISYTVNVAGCTGSTIKAITVTPLPNAGIISAPDSICAGASATIVNNIGGGMWSSSNTAVGSIGSSGAFFGLSSGTVSISYTVVAACSVSSTKLVRVSVLPPHAGVVYFPQGSPALCTGGVNVTALNDIPGGKWVSVSGKLNIASDGRIRTQNSGIDTILYIISNACGSRVATKIVTINEVPAIDFSFVQDNHDRRKVNFFPRSSLTGATYFWSFGDGSQISNVINPFHTYVNQGIYTVCLDVFRTGCQHKKCTRISAIRPTVVPDQASNAGIVTVDIWGSEFGAGSDFKLQKQGKTDIYGDTLIIIDPAHMRTRVNLTSVDTGAWDIYIKNSTGSFNLLERGFLIKSESKEPQDLEIVIGGPPVTRVGQKNRYIVYTINNRGTDVSFVPVVVTNLPKGATLSIENKVLPSSYFPGIQGTTPIKYNDFEQNENGSQYSNPVIPNIPAGAIKPITITVLANEQNNTAIKATVFEPAITPIANSGSTRISYDNASFKMCMSDVVSNSKSGTVIEILDGSKEILESLGPIGERAAYLVNAGTCGYKMGEALVDAFCYAFCDNMYKWYSGYELEEPLVRGPEVMGAGIDAVLDCMGLMNVPGSLREVIAKKTVEDVYLDLVESATEKTTINFLKEDICKKVSRVNNDFSQPVIFGMSYDPNHKIGPGIESAGHYINGKRLCNYSVAFENLPQATLPAQTVVVTDTLDRHYFDPASFGFLSVTVGDSIITFSDRPQTFIRDIDFSQTRGVKVRVIGSFDTATGIAKWVFLSVDPATDQMTENPLAGFLPPNNTVGDGEGTVSYLIKTIRSHRDTTHNKASIVFDANAPIVTNDWQCVIDTVAPASSINELPSISTTDSFIVSWHGKDNFSGIRKYNVFVSVDNSEYVLWLSNRADTFAYFKGENRSNYRFYSIATDSAGNTELAPSKYDAITQIWMDTTVTASNVRIFPNPANTFLVIDAPTLVNVMLSSMNGQVVLQKDLTNDIDTSPLPNGVYIIRVYNRYMDLVKIDKVVIFR